MNSVSLGASLHDYLLAAQQRHRIAPGRTQARQCRQSLASDVNPWYTEESTTSLRLHVAFNLEDSDSV